jgi:hypothetical protein
VVSCVVNVVEKQPLLWWPNCGTGFWDLFLRMEWSAGGTARVRMTAKILLWGWVLLGGLSVAGARDRDFSNWPAGTSPREIGKLWRSTLLRVRTNIPRRFTTPRFARGNGPLTFAQLAHDDVHTLMKHRYSGCSLCC